MMAQVAIVSAVRTPIGNFGGGLKDVSAAELGTVAAQAAMSRAGDILERRNSISPMLTAIFTIWSSTLLFRTPLTPSSE